MPAYLVVHAERRGDDTVIEDPHLTVDFTNGWALFKEPAPSGNDQVVLAIPATQISRIERVDDPHRQEPAPHKE